MLNSFGRLMLSMLLVLFTQAGCANSEPTEAEMFEAMINSDHSQQMFGDPAKMKAETQKAGCEKLGENAYKCGIASKNGNGMVLPLITFIRAGEKWKLAM